MFGCMIIVIMCDYVLLRLVCVNVLWCSVSVELVVLGVVIVIVLSVLCVLLGIGILVLIM